MILERPWVLIDMDTLRPGLDLPADRKAATFGWLQARPAAERWRAETAQGLHAQDPIR